MSEQHASSYEKYFAAQQLSSAFRRCFQRDAPFRLRVPRLRDAVTSLQQHAVSGWIASGKGCIVETGPTLAVSFGAGGALFYRWLAAPQAALGSFGASEVFPSIVIALDTLFLLTRYLSEDAPDALGIGCVLSLVSTIGICLNYAVSAARTLRALPAAFEAGLGTLLLGVVLWPLSVMLLVALVWILRMCLAAGTAIVFLVRRRQSRSAGPPGSLHGIAFQASAGFATLFDKVFRVRFILLTLVTGATVVFFNKNIWEFLSLMRPSQLWFLTPLVIGLISLLVLTFADQTARVIWNQGREAMVRSFGESRIPSRLAFLPPAWREVEKALGIPRPGMTALFEYFESTIGPALFPLFRMQFIVRTLLVVATGFAVLLTSCVLVSLVTTGPDFYTAVTHQRPGLPSDIRFAGLNFLVYPEVLRLQLLASSFVALVATVPIVSQLFTDSPLQLGHLLRFRDKCMNWYCTVFLYLLLENAVAQREESQLRREDIETWRAAALRRARARLADDAEWRRDSEPLVVVVNSVLSKAMIDRLFPKGGK